MFGMISSQLHQIAKNFDIHNGYQFQKFTGFSTSMSYALWNKQWKAVNLKTLNTLCNLFKCTPNDLIDYVPDPEEIL